MLFFLISVLFIIIPVLGSEGKILTAETFPLCNQIPSKVNALFNVFWFSNDMMNLYKLAIKIKKQEMLQ